MQETQPVIEYYDQQEKLIHIDASKSVDEVQNILEVRLNE